MAGVYSAAATPFCCRKYLACISDTSDESFEGLLLSYFMNLSELKTCSTSALPAINFFLVGHVEERLWWPIQGPNKGRKKKANSYEEREIRSSLLILDLKDGKL